MLMLVFLWQPGHGADGLGFTLAVIPDTQNYIDFRHQKAEGFEFDAHELFIQQMRFVAARSVANGGDIAFVAVVGDVWQHQTELIDAAHERRGMSIEPDPVLARRAKRPAQVLDFELPTATSGYRIVSEAGLPFGVAPGNHDYDAAWSVAGYPPNREKPWSEMTATVEDLGLLHVGGLDNFRSVFGAESDFFRDQPWYVASFRGGANSAQVFSAAGYRFLHIALEMHPDDEVLRWAELVMQSHANLPTIVTTHEYLNPSGERLPHPLTDLTRADPDHHNSPEQVWNELIRRHSQVFLVLCGHQHGQGFSIDYNDDVEPVYQILADYQSRGRAAVEAGREKPVGIGDGWLRLMRFDLTPGAEQIAVGTYSSYFGAYSSYLPEYAAWYRERERPQMTDAEFHAVDKFVIDLSGFAQRFGDAR